MREQDVVKLESQVVSLRDERAKRQDALTTRVMRHRAELERAHQEAQQARESADAYRGALEAKLAAACHTNAELSTQMAIQRERSGQELAFAREQWGMLEGRMRAMASERKTQESRWTDELTTAKTATAMAVAQHRRLKAKVELTSNTKQEVRPVLCAACCADVEKMSHPVPAKKPLVARVPKIIDTCVTPESSTIVDDRSDSTSTASTSTEEDVVHQDPEPTQVVADGPVVTSPEPSHEEEAEDVVEDKEENLETAPTDVAYATDDTLGSTTDESESSSSSGNQQSNPWFFNMW